MVPNTLKDNTAFIFRVK